MGVGNVGEEREVLRNTEKEQEELQRKIETERKELKRKIEAEQKELQRNIETKQEKLRNIENQGNEAGEQDNLQKVEIQKKIPLVEVKKEIEWSKEEQEILHRAEAHEKKPAESNRLRIDQPEKQQVKSP